MSYARRYMFQCTYVHSLVLCQRQVPGIHLLQNPRSPALLFICNWPWDSSHLLPTQGGAWDWVQVLKSDTMFVLPKAGPWYPFPPNTIPPKVCMRLRAGLKMWYHVCSWGYCIFTRWYPLSFLRRLVARLVEHVELHGESIVKPDITGLCIQSIYLFESFEQTKYINSTIQCHIN